MLIAKELISILEKIEYMIECWCGENSNILKVYEFKKDKMVKKIKTNLHKHKNAHIENSKENIELLNFLKNELKDLPGRKYINFIECSDHDIIFEIK